MQRLIIQDRALRIAPSTASVKGADHNVGGSCRARLAGRQRTADRQEAGVNDPSAQRPGALPLLPDRLVTEALTITSGSPQTADTTGTDSSTAAIERPRPTLSGRGVGALRGCRRWGSTWDFLGHFLILFAWITYLLVLFQILGDLFRRDHKTLGWVKAIWVAF